MTFRTFVTCITSLSDAMSLDCIIVSTSCRNKLFVRDFCGERYRQKHVYQYGPWAACRATRSPKLARVVILRPFARVPSYRRPPCPRCCYPQSCPTRAPEPPQPAISVVWSPGADPPPRRGRCIPSRRRTCASRQLDCASAVGGVAGGQQRHVRRSRRQHLRRRLHRRLRRRQRRRRRGRWRRRRRGRRWRRRRPAAAARHHRADPVGGCRGAAIACPPAAASALAVSLDAAQAQFAASVAANGGGGSSCGGSCTGGRDGASGDGGGSGGGGGAGGSGSGGGGGGDGGGPLPLHSTSVPTPAAAAAVRPSRTLRSPHLHSPTASTPPKRSQQPQ